MKKLIFYLIVIFLPVQLYSQGCFPEGIVFSTQEEIDLFPATYPNCTEIEGNLEISGTNIINVDALDVIEKIGGGLIIHHCPTLENIDGFSNIFEVNSLSINNNEIIEEISGFHNISQIESIQVFNNPSLIKVNAFSELATVHHELFIRNCVSLSEFDAFSQLITIGEDFEFMFNESISYCPIFSSLTTIGANFSFINNNEVKDLTGFSSLSSIGGYTMITSNNQLENFKGFDRLNLVYGNFDVRYNKSLINFEGLHELYGVGGDFKVWDNKNLISFEGLESLDTIGQTLQIYLHPNLSDLHDLIKITSTGGIWIAENPLIQNLMGLQNLATVNGGWFQISDNANLHSLVGIDSLDYHSIGYLKIDGNRNLNYCQVESMCNWVEDPDAEGMFIANDYYCEDNWKVHLSCTQYEQDYHSFPLLIDYPKWNVLECDHTEPYNCNTKSFQYLSTTDLCWIPCSIMQIGSDSIFVWADEKKTYYRRARNCWQDVYLLYDFGLEIGETTSVGWNHYLPIGSNPSTIDMTVKNKYQEEYSGKLRTVLEMEYEIEETKNTQTMLWVEGIGSLTHPFYPFVDLNNSNNHFELLCQDSLLTQIYQNPVWNSCDTLVDGIENYNKEEDIYIYPNPFKDVLVINFENLKINHIKVYSISGHEVYNEQGLNKNKHQIELNNKLPEGVYILQLFTDKGVYRKKIIKYK